MTTVPPTLVMTNGQKKTTPAPAGTVVNHPHSITSKHFKNLLEDDVEKQQSLPKTTHTFKQEFQKARTSKGLTQEQLARLINVNDSIIRNIEAGSLVPNPSLLNRINAELGSKLKTKM